VFPPLFLLAMGQLGWENLLSTAISTGLTGLVVWPLGGWCLGIWAEKVLKKGDPTLHLSYDSSGRITSSSPLPLLKERSEDKAAE
jgi:hypothetical protein